MAAKPDLREYLKKTQERFARPASHAYSVSGQHGMCARAAERGKDKRVRGANGACARATCWLPGQSCTALGSARQGPVGSAFWERKLCKYTRGLCVPRVATVQHACAQAQLYMCTHPSHRAATLVLALPCGQQT